MAAERSGSQIDIPAAIEVVARRVEYRATEGAAEHWFRRRCLMGGGLHWEQQ